MGIQYENSTEDEVASIDSLGGDALLIGFKHGRINLLLDSPVSTKTKNDAQVTTLFSVSEKLAFVFYDRGVGKTGAWVYTSPELQSISGLTFYDTVGGMAYTRGESSEPLVVLFTPAALRLVKLNIHAIPKAKVLKTIELRDVVSVCRSEEVEEILVATCTEYQIINLKTDSRVPLFPIMNGLKPLMASVGPDFLLVQGTSKDEPSMGLFVDTKGEVSRNGLILQWPFYPIDLVVSSGVVLAVGNDGTLVAQRLREDTNGSTIVEPEAIELSNRDPDIMVKRIYPLRVPVSMVHDELVSRLGNSLLAKSGTNVVFLLSDNSLDLYNRKPIFFYYEKLIDLGECLRVPQSQFDLNTQAGAAQYAYLSALLLLRQLGSPSLTTSDLVKTWKLGDGNPSRNVIFYIYGYHSEFPYTLYPGLCQIVQGLREDSENLDLGFFKYYVRADIRRLRQKQDRTTGDLHDLVESEVSYAKILLKDSHKNGDKQDSGNLLSRFLMEKGQKSKDEIIKLMHKHSAFDELRYYFSLTEDFSRLNQLNMDVIRDPQATDAVIQEASQQLADYALSTESGGSNVSFDIWDIAIELLQNPRTDSTLAIKLLTSPKFEQEYEPTAILEVLKESTGAGPAWRNYLKHLVSSRGLFKNDLASLVVADLIESLEMDDGRMLRKVNKAYEIFSTETWPKPTFKKWLLSNRSKTVDYPTELLQIQSELWDIMERGLDWISLMPTFEVQLKELKFERAVIYSSLGLIEQSLQISSEITDFRSILDYPSQFESTKAVQTDVTTLVLRVVLDIKSLNRDQILREFLRSPYASHLDMRHVLELLPDTQLFSAIADFFLTQVAEQEDEERQSQWKYALSRASLR